MMGSWGLGDSGGHGDWGILGAIGGVWRDMGGVAWFGRVGCQRQEIFEGESAMTRSQRCSRVGWCQHNKASENVFWLLRGNG